MGKWGKKWFLVVVVGQLDSPCSPVEKHWDGNDDNDYDDNDDDDDDVDNDDEDE